MAWYSGWAVHMCCCTEAAQHGMVLRLGSPHVLVHRSGTAWHDVQVEQSTHVGARMDRLAHSPRSWPCGSFCIPVMGGGPKIALGQVTCTRGWPPGPHGSSATQSADCKHPPVQRRKKKTQWLWRRLLAPTVTIIVLHMLHTYMSRHHRSMILHGSSLCLSAQ